MRAKRKTAAAVVIDIGAAEIAERASIPDKRASYSATAGHPVWERTVQDFIAYLRAKDYSHNTQTVYFNLLAGRFGFFDWHQSEFGKLPDSPMDLTADILQRFSIYCTNRVSERRRQPIAWRTRRAYGDVLTGFCNFLAERGMIKINPACGIIRPRTREEEPRYTPDEHVAALIEAVSKHPLALKYRAILALMINAGLRIGEVAKLRLEDYQNGMVVVRLPKSRRDRKMPVNRTLAEALDAWLRVRPPDGPFIFPGRDRVSGAKVKGIRDIVVDISKEAGIAPYIRPHDLRAFFARKLDEAGVNITVISKLMGHKNVQVTTRYISVLHERCEAAVHALDAIAQ